MNAIVRHPLVRAVLGTIWLVVAVLAVQALLRVVPLPEATQKPLGLTVGLAAMIVAYVVFVRGLERRLPTELAVRAAPLELLAGAALGAALFATTVGVLALLGVYSVVGRNGWGVVVPVLLGALGSGVSEELIVRGMIFRPLEEWLGTWLATGISALLFGLLHLANPNAGIVPALAIALEAGVLLAGTYVLTRRLWLPIGLHIAWNFTQAGIFGIAVSGNEMPGLLKAKMSGPQILSGGAFGAEASVVAVVVCTSAAIGIFVLAAKRGRVIPPPWRR